LCITALCSHKDSNSDELTEDRGVGQGVRFQHLAPGDDMRSGGEAKFSRLLEADKLREIADVVLVSLTGFFGADVGEPSEFSPSVRVRDFSTANRPWWFIP